MFDLAGVIPNIADKILKRLEIEEPTRNEVEQITLDRAFDGGARDGREGKPREANPHPPGSDHHAMHDRGYLQGMAAIAAEMAPQPPAEAQ
jgi:ribosome modulation factor